MAGAVSSLCYLYGQNPVPPGMHVRGDSLGAMNPEVEL